ncbi:hypothetical protein BGZ61DRAFT_465471 [Ilyonectria robusta]|uniref:uncharacterized protein n=1 Tax=Ilyonectria robusta TaxID=1079257 RepID=UPI001E8D4201|nr:uncharacterized protein BGZ61DRAFT_465471 [Ilyonectria robusta]KAH8659502.1 hypothetical protein BGZ61DRAFT_465471 [Ilyonectria robusta]
MEQPSANHQKAAGAANEESELERPFPGTLTGEYQDYDLSSNETYDTDNDGSQYTAPSSTGDVDDSGDGSEEVRYHAIDREEERNIYELFATEGFSSVSDESSSVLIHGYGFASAILAHGYAKRCPRANVVCPAELFFSLATQERPKNWRNEDEFDARVFDIILTASLGADENLEEEIFALNRKLCAQGHIEVCEFEIDGNNATEWVKDREMCRRMTLDITFKEHGFCIKLNAKMGSVPYSNLVYTPSRRLLLFTEFSSNRDEISSQLTQAEGVCFKLTRRLFIKCLQEPTGKRSRCCAEQGNIDDPSPEPQMKKRRQTSH